MLSYHFTKTNLAQLSSSSQASRRYLTNSSLSDDAKRPMERPAEVEQELEYKRRICKDWEAYTPLAPVKNKPWVPKNPEVVWPHTPKVTKEKINKILK